MKLRLACVALSVLMAGCQPATPAVKAPDTAASTTGTTNNVQAVASKVSEPATMAAKLSAEGGDTKGIVGKVEDAGYPMFRIVLILEDGSELEALFNNEALILKDGERPEDLMSKSVTATIKVTDQPSLLQLEADGKKVYERDIGPDLKLVIPPDAKSITGTLTGATEGTGDLPGELTVTASDGTIVKFLQFFEPALAAQEGKVVKLTYDSDNSIDITAIKLDPNPSAQSK